MALFPLALEHHLRAEVGAAGNDHQARDAVEGRRHPVGVELVAHHGHLLPLHAHPAAGCHQREGQRLGGTVEIREAQFLGEGPDALLRTVGDDGEADAGFLHLSQPPGHFVRQLLAAVSGQGVVDVQHEGADALARQKLRGDVGDVLEHIFGGDEHSISPCNENRGACNTGSPTSALATRLKSKATMRFQAVNYLNLRLRAASDFFLRLTDGFS